MSKTKWVKTHIATTLNRITPYLRLTSYKLNSPYQAICYKLLKHAIELSNIVFVQLNILSLLSLQHTVQNVNSIQALDQFSEAQQIT